MALIDDVNVSEVANPPCAHCGWPDLRRRVARVNYDDPDKTVEYRWYCDSCAKPFEGDPVVAAEGS